MTNPLRGLFRPTPEDRAALDVVRKAMNEAAPRVSLAELRQSWDVGVWEIQGE